MDTKPNFNLSMARFASTSDEEMKEIMQGKDMKNTTKSTKSCMKILNEYLAEKGCPVR